MIIPFSHLQELSGRKRPTAVRRWLSKSRIHHKLNADGEPFTTQAMLDAALSVRRTAKTEIPHEEPDFTQLTASARRLDSSRELPTS
jgi:Domain of unknown function (DUF4224)